MVVGQKQKLKPVLVDLEQGQGLGLLAVGWGQKQEGCRLDYFCHCHQP